MISADPVRSAPCGQASSPVPSSSVSVRTEAMREDVLVFSFRGMRFALPAGNVIEVMAVSGARWEQLAGMSRAGTLGNSGLPLIRLASRLGFADEAPAKGGLVLFGEQGKVRATVLIDDVPVRMRAAIESMSARWRERFTPCEDMIDAVALLPDGSQAAMVQLPLGVVMPRAKEAQRQLHDTAHLLVRAEHAQIEAVRIATLSSLSPLEEAPGLAAFPSTRRGRRMVLQFGGEGGTLLVNDVVGVATGGRIERVGGLRFLSTPSGRFRLLEPGVTPVVAAPFARVLVTAPEGGVRSGLRDLVRAMGHDVSLADDPRAARLVGSRFDVILFDLDAYADELAEMQSANDKARRIGFTAKSPQAAPQGFEAVLPAADPVALVGAMLRRPMVVARD